MISERVSVGVPVGVCECVCVCAYVSVYTTSSRPFIEELTAALKELESDSSVSVHVCNILPRSALQCNTLQRTATHCNSVSNTHAHAHALTHTGEWADLDIRVQKSIQRGTGFARNHQA